MKVTKMNSAKKNSIKTILSRALVVLLSYAMISSTSPAGYVAAYGLDETTDVAAEQAATTEETQATEAAPAETPAPAEEPAQAAPAQTETTIALNLGNGYITYYGQTIAAPTSSLSVPTDRDFTFAAAANGGYTLKAVYRTMGESETPIAANADGTYTLAASDFAAGVGIRIETEGAASEGAAATSLTSAQDALDQVLADSTETVYTYEDQYVSVTATLSDPHAVPDDADFVVTPITKDAKDENGNPVYAYDTYLDALNGGTTTEDSIYTSENTLFYDVAFMYPELGEDGQPTGRTIEFEPANGTVKLDITFKQAQLSDALGVTDDNVSEVTINHLDINEEVREAEGSTAEATDLSVDDIKVENLTAASDASVSVEESDSATVTLDSLSPLGFTVNTDDGGWTDGQLNYATNSTKNAFTSSEYYNANRSLGIAGNFHIVAFDTATLTTHTNGNVLAHNLIAQSNFGTNQLTDELSYVQNIEQFPNSGLPRTTDVLVVGSGVQVGTQDNLFTLNGTRIDRPHYLIQDKDTSSAPYIDLDEVKTDIENRARAMSQVSDTGVTVDFSDQNNRTITYVAGSGAGYYNMTAADFNKISNTPLNIKGFTSGSEQAVIINIDCTGATEINTPQQMNVYVDGGVVSRSETGEFSTGKVILNFYNTSEDLTINATNVCGQIIAPNANLSVANGNGNFIARNITIKGETHRTDFTGTTTPFRASVSGVKTVDGNAPTESFTFDSYALVNGNWEKDETVTSNATTGSFSFSEKTYEAEGTYWYAISENQSGVSGYNLATDLYLVKVEIQKQSSGDSTAYTLKSVTYYKAKQGVTSSNADGTVDIAAIVGAVNENKLEQLSSGATFRADQITFNNTTARNGKLKVTKTTTGANTPDTASFTVTGPDGFTPVTFTYADIKAAGGTYTLSNLPEGTYTVTEDETSAQVAGYNLVVTNNGVETQVTLGNESNVTLINTYTKKTGTAQFGGTKVYEGQLASSFGFTATLVKVDGKKVKKSNDTTYHASVNGAGAFTFPEITYDKTGTYTYEVTEDNGGQTLGGIVYDGHSYNVTVEVTEGADGLVSKVSGADKVTFTNTDYTATGHVTFEGTKSISGRDMTANDVYTFVVKDNQTGQTWEVNNNTTDGKIAYPKINYTLDDLGTHTYTVTETAGSNSSIAYDKTSYTVTVTVKDETKDGKLEITTSDNAKSLNFTNTYSATGSLTLSGTKALEDQGLNETNAKLFTYEVLEVTKDGKTIKTVQRPVATNANGSIAFQPISYTLVDKGTHYYIVREIIPEGSERVGDTNTWKSGSYIYDGTNYRFTVEVSDNGDGTLSVRKSGDNPEALNFTNTYKASGSVVLTASKVLVGREMNQGEFTFKLKDAQGNELQTVTNDANSNNGVHGSVTFAEITYTKADLEKAVHDGTATKNEDGSYTVTYTIEEVAGTDEHITYANNTVNVTVTVVDNGNGTLTATPSYGTAGNKFVNTYNASGSITLTGHKSYEGQTDGQFTFTVTDADGKVVSTGSNKANGDITFTPIDYTLSQLRNEDGTYSSKTFTYTVTEDKGGTTENGIHYDGKSYQIEVTVTDDGLGNLNAVRTDDKGALNFTNTYTATGRVQFAGTKTMEGRALNVNEVYTFSVKEGDTEVATGRSDASGKITFTEINYTLEDVGEHTYTITENTPTQGGVTATTGSRTVKVTVSDDGNGNLSVAKTEGDYELTFVNTYNATGTFELAGIKHMEGRDLKAGDNFTYTVKDHATGKVVTTGSSNESGTITYAPISYKLDDMKNADGTYATSRTFTYDVTEDTYDAKGVKSSNQLYSFTVTVTDDGNGHLNAVKTSGDDPTQLDFTNTYSASGSITLEGTKTLTGRTMTAGEFTFQVKEGDTVVATGTNDADGKITFTPDLSYTAAGEHDYTVSELEPTQGGVTATTKPYNIHVSVTDNGDGTLTATRTDHAGDLAFTNEYASSSSLSISGVKEITGREFVAGDHFTFTLTAKDNAPLPTNTTVSIDPTSGSEVGFTFDAINYTQADAGKTYTYYVNEEVGTAGGLTYDKTVKTVKVKVTDDGQGNLTAQIVSEKSDPVEFTNTYHHDSTSIGFTGTKVLTGRDQKLGEFHFQIKEDDEVVSTGTNATNGAIVFTNISYDKAGEHNYTVSEVIPDDAVNADGVKYSQATPEQKTAGGFTYKGVTYNNTTYDIHVSVTDDNQGHLVATRTDNVQALTFTNTYAANGSVTLTGTKTYEGQTDGQFSFTVTDESGKVVSHGTNKANGEITFEPISYGLSDAGKTFTYTVAEVAGDTSKTGITYDKTTYTVKVKVTDNGNGTLKAEVTEDSPKVEFTNTYDASGELVLSGHKSYEGQTDGQFSFTVTDESGKVVSHGTNKANGEITFEPISYSLSDADKTFTYTVAEVAGDTSKTGITYDKTTYTVEVKVTDNGNGTLSVTPTEDSAAINGLNFTNTYAATGEITFHGTKTYEGQKAGQFNFTVAENGAPVAHGTNAADGTITFDKISYTLDNLGTHTYTVTEDIPAQARNAAGTTYANASADERVAGGFVYEGITYDSTPQTVTVEVKDDVKDGKLEITSSKNAQALAFTNTYGAKGSITLEATKTLTGRDMAAGEFTFQVKEGDTVVATGTNAAAANGQAGAITFSTINYTEAGEHDYTVSEVTPTLGGVTAGDESYDVHVSVKDNGDGTLTATASYPEGGVAFTNTYEATGEVTFHGAKSFDSRDVRDSDTFTFNIAETTEGVENPYNGTATSTGATISYPTISYTLADVGEHTYHVTEADTTAAGVTKSTQSYDVTVTVADHGDGTLTVTKSDNTDALNFTNTYTASGSVTLEGTKTLTGRDMTEGEFGFTVTDNATKMVVARGSNAAATNGQTGTITFAPITYTQADMVDAEGNFVSEKDFTYTVKENGGTKGGVAYSIQSFQVTVHVEDDGAGNLTATATYPTGDVAFTNTYTHEGTQVTFGGHKNVENKNPENADKDFTFQLVETDADGNTLEGGETQTVTRTGAGDYSFAPISYTEAGTHYYKVNEVAGDAAGYSYDTTVYTETVTVTDNGQGSLVAEVTGTSTDAKALNFTNTYQAEATDATLSAVKNLTGRAWAEGDTFNFELKTTNGAPMPADAGAIATADATGDHKATFGSIHYTQVGEYKYTISELAPTAEGAVKNEDGTYTLNGVTYNPNAVSVVTVNVTDNDGQLVADVKYDNKADLPVFTNTYQASKTTATLEAAKELNGGDITDFDGKFSFTLTAGKNDANVTTPMPTAAGDDDTLTVTNAGAAVSFGDIEYAKAGTYNYTITEVQGDQGGVTYDETEHSAKVVVEDDGQGALHATVTYDDVAATEDAPSPAPVFTNTYFAAKATISADKHYFGAGNGAFNFTLVKTDARWNAIDDGIGTFANYGAGDAVVDEGQPFQITVSNGAYENGVAKVEFPAITYYEAGAYYYKLAETSEDATDASIYLVTVTVDENQQATVTYQAVRDGQEIADATPTDAPAFYNNGYVAAAGRAMRMRAMRNAEHSVNVMPVVHKELDGATLEEGQFTFLLEGEDGTKVTATNDADGTVAFARKTADGVDVKSDENGVLTFTKPGTYTYTITEVAGEDQLIKYDDSEITVTVTVKADAKGKLTATTSYEGATKTTDDGTPVFVNKVKPMDLRTRKVSKVTGDPLPGATYGLWMANPGGEDVYLGNAVSDENGYLLFEDFQPEKNKKYYFKEEAAPAGHLVDPYRGVYMIFVRTDEGYDVLFEGTSDYEAYVSSHDVE